MTSYLLRRFFLIIPTFLGVTILVFAITRFVPGGPIERMVAQMKMGEQGSVSRSSEQRAPISEEQLQQLKEFYGFDKPVLQAYFEWLGKLVQLDLGTSTRYFDPVIDIIKERLPISCFYGLTTLLLTYLICIPLGILKAVRHKTLIDNSTSVLVFVGHSIPAFVVGIVLVVVFAAHLKWFPMSGFHGDQFDDLNLLGKAGDILYHAVLPLISYLMGSFAVMTLLMKNSLIEQLASDYMRTAMAKGLPYRQAVVQHAVRNSLIPIATHFGNNISVIIAGSFFVERVFNIDGFGLLGYESIVERDYPVVLGILVISSMLQLVGNILSDICVAFVDPRVQFK